MPNVNSKTPDWLRQMGSILEELNEGVVIVDDQLRVVFANEALIRTFCGSMNQAIATDAVELSFTSLAKMVRRSGADIKTLDFFPVEMLKTFPFGTSDHKHL
jgi:hypothetical protein